MATHVIEHVSRTVVDGAAQLAASTPTSNPDRNIRSARALTYFKQVWYLLGCFIALVSLYNISAMLYLRIRKRYFGTSPTRGTASLARIPASLMNAMRAIAFRWTIPLGSSLQLNFAKVFLTLMYCGVLFTWSLMNSTNLAGQEFDVRYWANRTGNIAATQIPLVIALGMKNNIISLVTGVGFDKLNILHRMAARVLCLLSWLHGVGRIKIGMTGHFAWTEPGVQCGLLAVTSLSLLSILSIRPLRGMHYEFFLFTHFIFAFIFVAAAYFHAHDFDMGHLVWPSLVLWALDRMLRFLRMVIFNFGYFKPTRRSGNLDADIEVLSPEFVRISLTRPSYFHWLPGQCAYLTVPSISAIPLQAHPFTISTIDVPQGAWNKDPSGTDNEKAVGREKSGKQLVFLVRVRSGTTQRLLHAGNGDRSLTVFLDGPYGSPPPIRSYDTVVLIAGGSGVSFTLSLLLNIIYQAKEGFPECRRVVFAWAIRKSHHAEWISQTLSTALEHVSPCLSVDIQLFVTGGAGDDGDSEAKSGISDSEPKIFTSPFVTVKQGRPRLATFLNAEIEQAVGPVSVNVCGSPGLNNDVRMTLRSPRFLDVLKGGATVTLFVEGFGM